MQEEILMRIFSCSSLFALIVCLSLLVVSLIATLFMDFRKGNEKWK